MALKNIIITGSIGSYPTLSYGQKEYISSTDEQSFPIEQAVGSNGGSLPNLLGQTSSLDLFVNIDQKWSGFNHTPVGLLEYTHSIQDEFINGEFSGSSYVVTDGELVDEDCRQFLEVNTTLTPYNVFVYNSLDTPLPENSFLSQNTSPNQGEVYLFDEKEITTLPGGFSIFRTFKGGIKYIKINKIDALGNNNIISFQELTHLIIKFNDKGIIDYPILSKAEYPTYYLFETNVPIDYTGITYNPIFSSPPLTPYTSDNNILNYYLSTSNPSDQPGTGILYYTSVTGDSLGYLNLPTGYYQPQATSNISLIVSASAEVRSTIGTNATDIRIYRRTPNGALLGTTGFSYNSVSIPPTGTASLYLSGSFVPLEGETYVLSVVDDDGTIDLIASSVTLSITQSISPYSSSIPNLTVLEPYLSQSFYYSNCNALFGNQDGLEYDATFMKVNYNDGYLIPSNQQNILNNTAERAPVKPYNYSLRAQTRPRYEGVRVIQQNENIWTLGDISPDKTPSVQTPSTYFAYYDWVGGTTPDLFDKMGCHVVYLIDTDGNVFTPTIDSPYYPNLIDTFPSGKNVRIITSPSSPGSVSQIQATYPVLRPGVLPVPIIYTQIGQTNVVAPSMSFQNPLTAIPEYGSSVGLTNGATYASNNSYNILDVISPSSPPLNFVGTPNVTWNSTPPDRNFEINTTTNKTKIVPQLNINLQWNPSTNFPPSPSQTITINIVKFDSISSTWVNIFTQNLVVTQTTQNYSIICPPQDALAGDQYRITITVPPTSVFGFINQFGGTFTLTQTVPPSIQNITAPYWTTGSLSKNILTGSINMSSNVWGLTMTDVPNSGYFDNLPFIIQRLDEIRFEASDNQTYQILNVSSPLESSDGRLYLILDKDIVTGTDLDSFFLRRFNPDPSFVLLDTPVSPTPNASGFIIPEFVTKELNDNLPNIIRDLHERNLL